MIEVDQNLVKMSYEHYFSKHGMKDGWNTTVQDYNFGKIMNFCSKIARPCSMSLLDVGCGEGLLAQVWKNAGGLAYTGIDCRGESGQQIPSRTGYCYLEGEFLQANISPHDLIVASGSLSVGSQATRLEYFETMFAKMFSLARRGVYFNFISGINTGMSPFLSYEWGEIAPIVERFTSGKVLHEDSFVHFDGNYFHTHHVYCLR